jgi:hypothetical protein
MTESRLSTQNMKQRSTSMDGSSARLLTRVSFDQSPVPLPLKSHSRNLSQIGKKSIRSSYSPGFSFARKTRFECDIYEKFKRKKN